MTPPATTVELVEQRVFFVESGDKRDVLCAMLRDPALTRVLVFTRTKHGANRVAEQLGRPASPPRRSTATSRRAPGSARSNFRAGRVRVLVATDIAARGIDIDGITHVINFELPNVPETYVHRIGRTARAGAGGAAISFCDGEERAYLRDIERLIGQKVPVFGRPGAPQRRAA